MKEVGAAIADYAIIGDCRSAALVSRSGTKFAHLVCGGVIGGFYQRLRWQEP